MDKIFNNSEEKYLKSVCVYIGTPIEDQENIYYAYYDKECTKGITCEKLYEMYNTEKLNIVLSAESEGQNSVAIARAISCTRMETQSEEAGSVVSVVVSGYIFIESLSQITVVGTDCPIF